LQCHEAFLSRSSQSRQIEPERFVSATGQASKPLPQEDGGTAKVAAFKVKMCHSYLKDALKHGTQGTLRFMPELLQSIVTGIPISRVEQADGAFQAWIGQKFCLVISFNPRAHGSRGLR